MLTDLTVRQAKATGKPYTIADFDGLSLFVSATGAKTWHFRYTWVGQRARISLGVVAGRKLTIYRGEFRLKFDQGV